MREKEIPVVFTPDDDELQTIVMVAGSVPKNGNLEKQLLVKVVLWKLEK